tara:strand:- start:1479 stop:1688 length:210 start_codon:yes stop_codon:yes gene_type:complete
MDFLEYDGYVKKTLFLIPTAEPWNPKRFSARFIICIHCFDLFTWNINQNTVREHVQTPDNHSPLSLVVP